MTRITLNPLYIDIGAPALALGILLGALAVWLLHRSRQRAFEQEIARLEAQVKHQDALQQEREIAFEAASSRLARSFSEMSNQSLKSNSESFLRLAEQNLGTQQERAKRDLSEREKSC